MKAYEYFQNNYEVIKRENYRKLNLSSETKNILCDIGLPKEPFHFIRFNIDEIDNIELENKYIIIGTDFGTNICINDKEKILAVPLENAYPIRFINTNLNSLLECIFVLKKYEQEIDILRNVKYYPYDMVHYKKL